MHRSGVAISDGKAVQAHVWARECHVQGDADDSEHEKMSLERRGMGRNLNVSSLRRFSL